MDERFERTAMLLGENAMERLAHSRVAVFGVGGVGGYVVEALVRSGIGTIDLIDKDTVSVSNINRQIIAGDNTVGMLKTEAAAQRASQINPQLTIHTYPVFYTEESAEQFPFPEYDYIVDAVDTVSAKISLVVQAQQFHIPIISSMGAGNKLHPERFEIADIYSTSVCPLARVMRRELKKRNIPSLKVVYSKEEPLSPAVQKKDPETGKIIPASIAFVPSAVGMIIAGEVVRDLTGIRK